MRPESPRQAVSFAKRFSAPYIAGGTWLQPVYERDRRWPGQLVALNPGWPGFHGIVEESDHGVTIGALTTLDELARHSLTGQYMPALGGLMNHIAGPGVRHLGTVGGNLVAGGDLSALALALGVTVDIVEGTDVSSESLAQWIRKPAPGDLLRSVTVPDCRRWRVAVEKLGHRERFSPARATVCCVHDGQQTRLAVCGEGGPGRLIVTEAMLRDRSVPGLRDLATVVDTELQALGWENVRLRLAVRRILAFLLEGVSRGT